MTWTFAGHDITPDDIPAGSFGFIYVITDTRNGLKYLGKKQLKFKRSKQVKGKKKRYLVDSDWADYWSSSPYLKELVATDGAEHFTREIILFCKTTGELSYCEECMQYCLGVLESDVWMNGNIRSRVFGKNVARYESLSTMRQKISELS